MRHSERESRTPDSNSMRPNNFLALHLPLAGLRRAEDGMIARTASIITMTIICSPDIVIIAILARECSSQAARGTLRSRAPIGNEGNRFGTNRLYWTYIY